MKSSILRPSATPFANAVDLNELAPHLEALAEDTVAAGLGADEMITAIASGVTALSSLLRSYPVLEGRLLEHGIRLLAGCNPDLVVLTENIRLPVSPAALQLVEKNDEALYRQLTLDIDAPTRKSYTPDLIIVHRPTSVAYVVDVKRSLSSYESTRIGELKTRMLAGSLVVPDLLYRDHHRLVVTEVRVVIIEASGSRPDIERGVWPLSHLDHLLDVSGASSAITELRRLFKNRVDENWRQGTTTLPSNVSGGTAEIPAPGAGNDGGGEVETSLPTPTSTSSAGSHVSGGTRNLRVGFAKLSVAARH
jgi:hypothetical protein